MGASIKSTHRTSFPPAPFQRYHEIRPAIRSGDILLCAGNAIMSRLIQRATLSPWSHVALIVRLDAIDRILVLESVESIGVRAVPLSHYVGTTGSDADPAAADSRQPIVESRLGYDGELLIARHNAFASLVDAHLREVLVAATDLLGKNYDKAEILRIAARIASREKREQACAALQPDDAYICSEYVWECLRAGGIEVAHDPRGFIAPCDFLNDPQVAPLWRIVSRRQVVHNQAKQSQFTTEITENTEKAKR